MQMEVIPGWFGKNKNWTSGDALWSPVQIACFAKQMDIRRSCFIFWIQSAEKGVSWHAHGIRLRSMGIGRFLPTVQLQQSPTTMRNRHPFAWWGWMEHALRPRLRYARLFSYGGSAGRQMARASSQR